MSTSEGQEGLTFLRESVPTIACEDSHQIIFNAGRAQGWADCLKKLEEIIGVKEVKEIKFEND